VTLEQTLTHAFLTEHPAEAARALERMSPEARRTAVRAAGGDAAPALGAMVISAAAECLSGLTVEEALPVDTVIAALRRLPADAAERLVEALPHQKRDALRRVLRVPKGTAAALVDPTVLALPDDISVAEARLRLRREADLLLHYIYVVDRTRTLVGVLDISELMRARSRDPLRGVMHEKVERLPAWMPSAAVRSHPGWRSFHAMPVTDESNRLIGAIRYQTLRRLEQETDAVETASDTAITVAALGELFHLSVAGFVEGISTAAAPGRGRTRTAMDDERRPR
jgi:Mg/Co/Ni transporter MgtE